MVTYDNESAAFTDLMIKKINNAFFDPFYIPCKDLLDEGWYQIFLNSNGNIREYVLDSQDTIYDVKFHKNLRSNILSDIYVYIAKSHLNQLAGNVNE